MNRSPSRIALALALGCADGGQAVPDQDPDPTAERCQDGTAPPCEPPPVVEYHLEADFSLDPTGAVISPYVRDGVEKESLLKMVFPQLRCQAVLYLDGLGIAGWSAEEGWLFGVDLPANLEGVHNCSGFDARSFEGGDPLAQLRSDRYRVRRLALGGPLPPEVSVHGGDFTHDELARVGFGGLVDSEAFADDDFGGLDVVRFNIVVAARIDAYYDTLVLNPDGSEELLEPVEVDVDGAAVRALYHLDHLLPHAIR